MNSANRVRRLRLKRKLLKNLTDLSENSENENDVKNGKNNEAYENMVFNDNVSSISDDEESLYMESDLEQHFYSSSDDVGSDNNSEGEMSEVQYDEVPAEINYIRKWAVEYMIPKNT